MTKLMKALLLLKPPIADVITIIIRETVRISRCSKLNSFLSFFFLKKKQQKNKIKLRT